MEEEGLEGESAAGVLEGFYESGEGMISKVV